MTDSGCGPAHPKRPLPPTEMRLAASERLDELDSLGILELLHAEDRVAVEAVRAALPKIARLVDLAVERWGAGGTIHYFGAGTSGRLGVLDAVELRPTYALEPGRVVPHIAGGSEALLDAVEDAEDSTADGAAAARSLGPADIAIGLAASGNTPFVAGALAEASRRGAYTALVSSNPHSSIGPSVDLDIAIETGAEVVTGSTRMKAATAEKLVLNGFSTALMVRLGRTWSNLMVSLIATNEKLRDRSARILAEAAGVALPRASDLLRAADGDLKVAIVSELAGIPASEARRRLAETDGNARAAVALLPHTGNIPTRKEQR